MGAIYIIRHGLTNLYKVGTVDTLTNHTVQKRLRQLQSGNPIPLNVEYVSKDTRERVTVEREIHILLKNRNIRGEWFEIENINDVKQLIDQYISSYEISRKR